MPWWLVIMLVSAGGLAWLYSTSRRIDEARHADQRERALAAAVKKPFLSNRPVQEEQPYEVLDRPLNVNHWNPRIR